MRTVIPVVLIIVCRKGRWKSEDLIRQLPLVKQYFSELANMLEVGYHTLYCRWIETRSVWLVNLWYPKTHVLERLEYKHRL